MKPGLAEGAIAQTADRRLTLSWAATAGAVVLHNTEEWLLDMTGWIAGQSWLPGHSWHGDRAEFALVLAIVTVAVLGIAGTAVVTRPRWSAEAAVCVAYALMINGGSHVVLSLAAGSVMPGAISGVAVLLPVGAFVVRTVPSAPWTVSSVAMTIIAAVGITTGAFALASLLTEIH